MIADAVRGELEGGLLIITLDQPASRNALTPSVEAGLVAGIRRAADPTVRAVLLTATGTAFCGGGDITEMESNDAVSLDHVRGRADHMPSQVWRPLYELAKPVVAAVNGWAVGAGVALALGADLRIASDQARFRLGFSRVGLAPDMASAWLLPRLIGLAASLELALTDRVLTAADALALGLVHRVVAHEELADAAHSFASELATGPTVAFGATKRLMQASFERDLDQAIVAEVDTQTMLLQTRDHALGVAAFRTKERPAFEGR